MVKRLLLLPRQSRRLLIPLSLLSALWIGAFLLAGCAAPAPTPTSAPEGVTVIDPAKPISDFTLINHDGQETQLADLKGKYTLLAFGYTHCPDICPITLAHFKSVKMLLGEQAEQVQFVFVGVDTARDTPERLREYLPLFDPVFIGLTGEETKLREVIREFGGNFFIRNPGGLKKDYPVDHSAGSYLLNREGQWVRRFAYGTEPEIIAAEVQRMLKG